LERTGPAVIGEVIVDVVVAISGLSLGPRCGHHAQKYQE
jgi:hypothetical protein